ncbi:MFS transporter [Actinoplanes sp. NBRC 103695]|uniref:MFS transporter n=1 Tax=Actinoplanes sp. NBRC 103695 TaxID=3032202 RepID=UPI0024A2472F|nr:MFS transporter [Actinoplanes sp. NBRC 103695]GLY94373.1 MFS transporter [Actinoplanes sp. NBRC 103695]
MPRKRAGTAGPGVGVLLRNGPLRALLAASLISSTGDWILRTGLAYQIYVLTGSTLASAGAFLASLIPQIALGSVAGVYADRWRRRRLMVVTNLLHAAVLLPLLAVTGAGRVWIVLAVLAASSCLAPFFQAAEQALLPSLVPADRLVTANSLNAQVRDVSRLIGAALGGVVAAAGGIGLLAVVDVVTFLVAAGLLTLIPGVPVHSRKERSFFLREWVAGARLIAGHRTLRLLLAYCLITGVGEAIMGTLIAPFARDVLGADARAYGTILSAQAVGGLAGGLVTTLIGHRLRPRLMLAWGAIGFGLLDLVLFLYPLVLREWWPAPVLMILIGLPGAISVTGIMTVFQQATADEFRGRVFGALVALEGVAMLAGTGVAGFLPETFGIVPVIAAQGVGYVLAGLMVLVVRPDPGVERGGEGDPRPVEGAAARPPPGRPGGTATPKPARASHL